MNRTNFLNNLNFIIKYKNFKQVPQSFNPESIISYNKFDFLNREEDASFKSRLLRNCVDTCK